MTRSELTEMRNEMYYGHEIELSFQNNRYYFEQTENGFEIYLFQNDSGLLIFNAVAEDRNEMLDMIFQKPIFNNLSLNNSYSQFEIIAID